MFLDPSGRCRPGDVLPWDADAFHALPPLQTIIRTAHGVDVGSDRTVPVRLAAKMNALGLLQISLPSGRTRKRRSPGRSSSICVRTSMAAQPRLVRRLPRPSRRTPRPRPSRPRGATVDNVEAQIDAQNARIDQAREQVRQAQAATDFAKAENDRAQALLKSGSGTLQQAQQTESNLRQSTATLASAQANLTAAEKQIAVLQTQRDGAAAQLEHARAAQTQAETNLSRTQVQAPVRGRATSISAAKGDYAVAGQALMMFVPQEVWVTANFKETQLNHMRPDQPVDIRIDAYPGRSFAGRVDSIQSGSGAAFSLLPPQNATGNYVKVVQRVPVKIVFDTPPDVYVGPGMSVVPTVKVQ